MGSSKAQFAMILCAVSSTFVVLAALDIGPDISGVRNTATVGVGASVESNHYNQLAQQLTEKEDELDAREQEVIVRERQVQTTFVETHNLVSLVYTTVLALILFGLILLNFYLDSKRRQKNVRSAVVRLE